MATLLLASDTGGLKALLISNLKVYRAELVLDAGDIYVSGVLLKVTLNGLPVALMVRFAGSPSSDVVPESIVA